jgi:hypothetical protein
MTEDAQNIVMKLGNTSPELSRWVRLQRGRVVAAVNRALYAAAAARPTRAVSPIPVLDAVDHRLRMPPGFVSGPDGPAPWYSYDAQAFVREAPAPPAVGLIRAGQPGFEQAMGLWWEVAVKFAVRAVQGDWSARPRFGSGLPTPKMPYTGTMYRDVIDGVQYASNGHLLMPGLPGKPEEGNEVGQLDMRSGLAVERPVAGRLIAVKAPSNPHTERQVAVIEVDGVVALVDPVLLFVVAAAVGAPTWHRATYLLDPTRARPALGGVVVEAALVRVEGPLGVGGVALLSSFQFDMAREWRTLLSDYARKAESAQAMKQAQAVKQAAKQRLRDDPEYAKQVALDTQFAKLGKRAWLDQRLAEGVHHVEVSGWTGPNGTIPEGMIFDKDGRSWWPTKSAIELLYLVTKGAPVDPLFPQRLLDRLPATVQVNFMGERDLGKLAEHERKRKIEHHREGRRKAMNKMQDAPLGSQRYFDAREEWGEHNKALKALGYEEPQR